MSEFVGAQQAEIRHLECINGDLRCLNSSELNKQKLGIWNVYTET